MVGCLLVLTIAGGLAWAVRRRGPAAEAEDADVVEQDHDTTRTEA